MTEYKQHQIIRTEIRHANTLKPLYEVRGQFPKKAARTPFLTSLAAAQEWINDNLLAASKCYSTKTPIL